MWFCVNKVFYPVDRDYTIVVVKSLRRFDPPKWATCLRRGRSASEVVRLSDLGVVLRESGREYIKQYYGKWMRREEFLEVMRCALLRSYKSLKTVERMMRALEEFASKPVTPKSRLRCPQNAIYELPPVYPCRAVAVHARRKITIYGVVLIYVFSRTIHIVPWEYKDRATVVIPINVDEVSDIRITERGLNTLRDLLDDYYRLEEKYPEIAETIKLAVTLAKLLS
jgi:hypothetical protein